MRTTETTACLMLSALALSIASHVKAQETQETRPQASAPSRTASSDLARSTEAQRDLWRHRLLGAPRPKSHTCYRTVYPDTQWHEMPCGKPPKHFFPPRNTVGNGGTNDFAADPPNSISQAEGSFDSFNAASVATTNAGTGGANGANLFSLQLNTANFPTKVCPASAPKCLGFAQFVYDASSASAYVQYWLINPPSTCPAPWQTFEQWCVQTATTSTPFSPAPTVSDLKDMKVIGSSAGGGEVTVYSGGAMQSSPGGDNVFPDLATNWSEVEYNIFGDGGGGQATFNAGTTIKVRAQVDTGSNVLPSCVTASFTGETNNLDLVSTPVVPESQYPAIVFDESNAPGGKTASCSTSVGDPHVTTFDGLYYDFYAEGDFVLADAGPDFIVQARQESGAKVFNNPNVTMNTAVAIKMGASRISIYDSPARVVLDGRTIDVADDKITTLADGVRLFRVGSVYVVTRYSGELVRAQLYGGWMDLMVGLGHRPRASAHGIMASPTRTALSMRDGTRLSEPVSASDLYQRYAKSWLVQPNESLFAEHPIAFAAPAKVFTSRDLDPQVEAKARAACVAAGIAHPALLESCIVDAAVLKRAEPVKTFTRAIAPTRTIKPVETALKQ